MSRPTFFLKEHEQDVMIIRCVDRGYIAQWDETTHIWRYIDDGSPASGWSGGEERPCVRCHQMSTPEGYDPCLGHINGAINACCGHGAEPGYVQWEDGSIDRHDWMMN